MDGVTETRGSIYKQDQRKQMERAAKLAADLQGELQAPWMPYSWQESVNELRERLLMELKV